MGKELAKERCARWLVEHDCYIGELYRWGGEFVIVPGFSDVEDTPGFEYIVETATGVRYNWGMDDEYDYCSSCGKVLRTHPDSYCWKPDYWLSDEGYTCVECVKDNYLDEYLDNILDTSKGLRSVNLDIVDPEAIGFTKVLDGCEYGFHPGQNDDPKKVARWAEEHGLQILIASSPSQFTTEFDVYFRKPDETGDLYISEYGEDMVLTNYETLGIEHSLTERLYGYPNLRREFKQWPSPAQHVQAELKKAGSNFRTIHLDGSPTEEYDSFEDMCGKM